MAVQGLSRLLPLTLDPSSSPPQPSPHTTNAPPPPVLLPPTLLPRLETALAKTLRKPPSSQTRADEGLLGSPHLALTIAALPRLARETAASSSEDGGNSGGGSRCGGVFRSPEFVTWLRARIKEREAGMQEWERGMVVEGLRGLGVRGEEEAGAAAAAVPPPDGGGG